MDKQWQSPRVAAKTQHNNKRHNYKHCNAVNEWSYGEPCDKISNENMKLLINITYLLPNQGVHSN